MNRVTPDRISPLINLSRRVSEDRFDSRTNETYAAYRIRLPYNIRDARNQRLILLLTRPQALLCLPELRKVNGDSKKAGLVIQKDTSARKKTGYPSTIFGHQDRLHPGQSTGERSCGGFLHNFSLFLCDGI